jgi:hypothetical protein
MSPIRPDEQRITASLAPPDLPVNRLLQNPDRQGGASLRKNRESSPIRFRKKSFFFAF